MIWWYKNHDEPIEKWIYYPMRKAIRYTTYRDWRFEFDNAFNDIGNGFLDFWGGMWVVFKNSVLFVLTPILKPISFWRIQRKVQKMLEERCAQ